MPEVLVISSVERHGKGYDERTTYTVMNLRGEFAGIVNHFHESNHFWSVGGAVGAEEQRTHKTLSAAIKRLETAYGYWVQGVSEETVENALFAGAPRACREHQRCLPVPEDMMEEGR